MARAILDWTTADLARLTGLTANAINRIERGHVVAQKETLVVIQRIFEEAGLDFLPFSGVRKREQIVQVWEDEAACSRLLDDIYYELRDSLGEVLLAGTNDELIVRAVGKERALIHFGRLRNSGINERQLVRECDKRQNDFETHHCVPAKYLSAGSFCVYGNKLALVKWESPQKVIIINEARMTDGFRKLFNFVWDHTKTSKD